MGIKRGIIQSRGLGDIIISLPIAKFYADQGDEIYWPVCENFVSHFKDAVPWVNWLSVPVDREGRFFFDTPVEMVKAAGCNYDDCLYLYHYLSNMPELTDPELFSVLKFDQYKYWATGVPFVNKWRLAECIVRNYERENNLKKKLNTEGLRYAVLHRKGSSAEVQIDTSWLGENVTVIDVDDHLTDCIFDWLGVLESAEAFIGLDSVFANLVDCLSIRTNRYWIRRSGWDLTPVLGNTWTVIPTELSVEDPVRVKPAAAAAAKRQQGRNDSSVQSTVPFQASGNIPKDFMSALKKPAGSKP